MVHAARLPARIPGFIEVPRLDFNRIFGYATAIAVHVVLLLLLLVPITAPPSSVVPEPPRPIWFEVVKKIPPPEPPKPVPVVQRPTTHPSSTPRTVAPETPVVLNTARATDEAVDVRPPVDAHDGDTIGPPQPPRVGMQLEYAQAPAPTYPRDALRDGIEGTVMLRVLVDVDGRPLDVQVEHSSGNRSLDRAARDQVLQRCRFRPAMQNGRAVQAIGLVPVDFRLN
jgi:protein TonB